MEDEADSRVGNEADGNGAEMVEQYIISLAVSDGSSWTES